MEDDEWEVPKSEAPVYCMSSKVSNFDQSVGKGPRTNKPMDEAAIGRNDSTHVYWFAGWAMTQLEHFRRFHVISGARAGDANEPQRKEWGTKWNHVSSLNPVDGERLPRGLMLIITLSLPIDQYHDPRRCLQAPQNPGVGNTGERAP